MSLELGALAVLVVAVEVIGIALLYAFAGRVRPPTTPGRWSRVAVLCGTTTAAGGQLLAVGAVYSLGVASARSLESAIRVQFGGVVAALLGAAVATVGLYLYAKGY